MRQIAADGAAVAGLRVPDVVQGGRQQRAEPLAEGRALDVTLTGHRSDHQRAVSFLDPVQPRDLVQVDENRRLREP